MVSTTAIIGKVLPSGNIQWIELRWGGYPSTAGATLRDCYKSGGKVTKLMELGDLALLRRNLKPRKGHMHTFDFNDKSACLAYIRDAGGSAEANEARISSRVEFEGRCSRYRFAYLYGQDRRWTFSTSTEEFAALGCINWIDTSRIDGTNYDQADKTYN